MAFIRGFIGLPSVQSRSSVIRRLVVPFSPFVSFVRFVVKTWPRGSSALRGGGARGIGANLAIAKEAKPVVIRGA